MARSLFLASFLLAFSAQGADILSLVKILDRNDTAAFVSAVQTLEDANTLRGDNNKTVLMYACWVGNAPAVRHLVAKGADVNARDEGGATALHLAAWKGHNDIAYFLLDNGASGSAMSNEGMTPLDIAMMRENSPLVDAIEKAAPKLKSLFNR